ncbi:hypothetical protein B0A48_01635 [Cryoendolithus antarcticus]|uniref:Uncharacterized protein n=1 Tax=Cryoendolithus antarcticus TaxID=1507870 RepID=A0A1V8TPU7_9PEZI|nr:hypothetical protein B0A48_01635 [Cryoendolithus antarcticus]
MAGSSLTQLDFVSTPKDAEAIEIWSEEGSEDDLDTEKPRKKRRVSGGKSGGNAGSRRRSGANMKAKEKGQNTLTQIAWLPASSRAADAFSDDDAPDFNIYDDEGRDRFADMMVKRQVARKKKLPWLSHAPGEDRVSYKMPARRYDLRSPAKAAGDLDDSGYVSASTRSGATPAKRYDLRKSVSARKPIDPTISSACAGVCIGTRNEATPTKSSGLREVAASQTSPSIKASSLQSHVSTQTKATTVSPTVAATQRVPLGERSANTRLRPLQLQPSGDTVVKTSEIPLKEASDISQTAISGLPIAPILTMTKRSCRKLKRTLTVQDSQLEDLSISTVPPPRQLTRSTTIAETQFDSLDLDTIDDLDALSEGDALISELHHDSNSVHGSEQYLDDGPHTYDPVGAALDRDAARFAWTQTQMPLKRAREAVEDSETDDDPLDEIGADAVSAQTITTVDLTSPPHRPSEQLLSDLIDAISPQAARVSQSDERNASESAEENAELDVIADSSPPSSPPALHQSQISTIVPTQASICQQSLHEARMPASAQIKTRSRVTQHTQYGDAVSSSPLPLPPWSTPDRGDKCGATNRLKRTQRISATLQDDLGSLTDFSLPPPPPLMRSSSPWTGQ